MQQKIKILGFAAVLALAAIACGLNFNPPEIPEVTLPVPTVEIDSLEEAWSKAFEFSQETGSVSVTITEAQLTAFLAVYIANQGNLPLTNPSIDLRPGEMEIRGTYSIESISAEVKIVMGVSIGESGLPVLEVKSGSVGALPVPAELLSGISEALDKALSGQVIPITAAFELDAIVITEDALILTGSLK